MVVDFGYSGFYQILLAPILRQKYSHERDKIGVGVSLLDYGYDDEDKRRNFLKFYGEIRSQWCEGEG